MWLDYLRQAVDAEGLRKVADRLGYSHSALCQVLNGSYPAKTDRLAARVEAVLGQVACPHLGAEIAAAACQTYRERSLPGHSPSALAHFRACQVCPLNPAAQSSPQPTPQPKEALHGQ